VSDDRRRILEMLENKKISVSEAEQLLNALSGTGSRANGPVSDKSGDAEKRKPRYFRVDISNDGGRTEKVHIRIPLIILKSGVKLVSILPPDVSVKLSSALKEKGIDFDLSKLDVENVDKIIESLADVDLQIEDKNDRVRVYCQ
jgi:hypothetical protein